MMSAGLMSLWMVIWTGCAHYRVVSQEKAVIRMKAGVPTTPSVDGWFVPDARWLEMREAIGDRILELEPQNTLNTQK